MKMENNGNNAKAIIDAVERLGGTQDLVYKDPQFDGKETCVVALPKGLELHSVKKFHDEWLERPRRLKGTATAETQESFCGLVKQHKTIDTVIFASVEHKQLVAVVDYHSKGELGKGSTPSFCGHRVTYSFPISPEFTAWQNAAKFCGQGAFAQFLDAHRFDLIDPLDVETITEGSVVSDVLLRSIPREKRAEAGAHMRIVFASPADLMQLVESLSGHSKTKFSEVKTDRFGGMKATIEKEGRIEGDEKIPALFLIQIAAFVGGDKLVLPARIRAKVDNDKLWLSAELVGVERVLGAAFTQAVEEVRAETGCEVFRGTPEA
jgi:hypothetical protein